eukprot:scaffold18437_cov53-Phaeocystis_antarctica.AAC.1
MVLAGHWGLWRCLRWRDLGVVLDRVHAELLARNELRGGLLRDVTGGRDGGLPDLQGAPRAYNQNPCLTIAPDTSCSSWGVQTTRVLLGRVQRACCTDAICSWPAGSLCGMSFICGGEYRLGSTLLGYRRGCRWAIGR